MRRPGLNSLPITILLLFLGAWGAWAVGTDNQPTFADGLVPDSETLASTLLGKYGLTNYVEQLRYRPPLSHVPSALLFLINGLPDLLLARVGVLLQYLLMVWVAYSIGLVAAGRGPALLAAVWLGTTPMVFGWGRMAYMDTGLALMVLVSLRLLMANNLARARDGILLGLAVGGGLLTKVAFPIFAVGPVAWLLALKVRSLRAAGVLALAVVTSLVVISWWLIPNLTAIQTNAGMSATGSTFGPHMLVTMGTVFRISVLTIPGGVALFASSLLVSVAALILKPAAGPGRQVIVLFQLTMLLSLGLLLLFQPLTRYMVPVYAVAAVLGGISLGGVIMDRARRAAWPIIGGLSACLLLLFVLLNLGVVKHAIPKDSIVPSASPRISSAGMLTPDRRDYGAVPHLRQFLTDAGFEDCLVLANGPWVSERVQCSLDMYNAREKRNIFHHWVKQMNKELPNCLLVVTGTGKEIKWKDFSPQNERGFFDQCQLHAWYKSLLPEKGRLPPCGPVGSRPGPCLLGSWDFEPLDLAYFLHYLPPKVLPDKLPSDPFCKLDQVDWEEVIQPVAASGVHVDLHKEPESPPEDAPPPEPAEPTDPDRKEDPEPKGPPEGKDPDRKEDPKPKGPPEGKDPDREEDPEPKESR